MAKSILAAVLLFAIGSCAPAPQMLASRDGGASPSRSPVAYQLVRNATAKLSYGGETFLLDPMLSKKGALPSFAGIEPNPTIELPIDVSEILAGVDAVVVSHMHPDHFDQAAADLIDKKLPVFTPNNSAPVDPRDPVNTTRSFIDQLRSFGFVDAKAIGGENADSVYFKDIKITQVFGLHGAGQLSELMGGVNGIVLEAAGEPTIYWTGDTIFDEAGGVAGILTKFKPDIIIAHTGGPVLKAISDHPILIDEKQAVAFFKAAKAANPKVRIIAVHMGALDHCFTSKERLRAAIDAEGPGFKRGIFIPDEGETIEY